MTVILCKILAAGRRFFSAEWDGAGGRVS
jgi:hypothetical protein